MVQYYKLIIGLVLAWVYCMFMFKKEKDCPRVSVTIYPILYKGMIKIPIDNKALHVHHWLVYLFVLLWLLTNHVPYREFGIGFAIGMIAHGLHYRDCFEFITDNPYT